VSLDLTDLTVKITGEKGRTDYLWEIGSGANWLAYHVATTLALQKLFTAMRDSPVPGFLLYDQPSQVYFPRTLARDLPEGADPKLKDEDLAAVRKVFATLSESVRDAKGALQVIVLDHADDAAWGRLPGVQLVEEWRGPRKLVPEEWLRAR
jgi:hypothetical protein